VTGYIVRVERGGREFWADIDELTDAELEQVELPVDDLGDWVVALARWIRDHVSTSPQPRVKPSLCVLSISEARTERDGRKGGG
jgi:hypothetical protein